MKTSEEVQAHLYAIQQSAHHYSDDLQDLTTGVIAAQMWTLGQRPTWADCRATADEIWQHSRQTRTRLAKVAQ